MNADQAIEVIGKSFFEGASQEYCLFWSDYWWWMCMTKAEWSGWMQALGSVAAILITAIIAMKEGRIRRKKQEENDLILKKRIDYILHKTDILNSLEFFCYQWMNYEKISKIGSMPERTGKFPCTSFFIYTKNAFYKLRDAFGLMSPDNKEFILTSDYSFEFGNLQDLILFYEKMYGPLEEILNNYLSDYDDNSILLDIGDDNAGSLTWLEDELGKFHTGVISHRDELFELSQSLFDKVDYVPRWSRR